MSHGNIADERSASAGRSLADDGSTLRVFPGDRLDQTAVTRFVGPLFLVGMPRSGTKLLRAILNNHSTIRILEVETEFLPYWALHWDRFGDLSKWHNFLAFYGRVQRSPYMVLHRSEVGPPIEARAWYDCCRDFSAAGVFEALARHDAGVPVGSDLIWGDKSPSYVRSLPLLKHLYPQARFVHITRDVRDYCLSLNKALAKDMSRAAQRWADDIKSARRAGQSFGRDYVEVRYEDLITDPANIARQVCALVDRDFEPSMTTLIKPAEGQFEALGGAGSGLRVILGNNANKWQTRLNHRALMRIEAIAFDTLRQCNYPITIATGPRRLSAPSLAARQLLDGLQLIHRYRRFDRLTRLRFFWNAFLIASPSLKPWQRKFLPELADTSSPEQLNS